MFADLIRRLTAPAPDHLPDTDARLALGALLVRLARADGDYAAVEIARIDAILAKRYGLTDPAPLRAQCEVLESEAPERSCAPVMIGAAKQTPFAAAHAIGAP